MSTHRGANYGQSSSGSNYMDEMASARRPGRPMLHNHDTSRPSNSHSVPSRRAHISEPCQSRVSSESEEDLEEEEYCDDKPPRRGSTSSVASSIRRASIVIHDASEVLGKWGPLILFVVLGVPLLFTWRTIWEDVGQAYTKTKEGVQEMVNNTKTEIKVAKYQWSLSSHMELNMSSKIQPFMHDYSKMLTNVDYETWFTNPRDADDVILAMYHTLPPAVGNVAIDHRLKLKGLIDLRSTLRRRAEVQFENFLSARLVAVEKILQEGRAYPAYLSWMLLNNDKPRFKLGGYTNRQKQYGVQTSKNLTSSMLIHATWELINKTLEAHDELYVPQPNYFFNHTEFDIERLVRDPKLPGKPLAGLRDLDYAMDTEKKFIKQLLKESPAAKNWTQQHTAALGKLKGRLTKLNAGLNEMERKLALWQKRFIKDSAFDKNRTTGVVAKDRPDRLVWLQSAEQIQDAWPRVLFEVQEALIYAQRRQETFRQEVEKFDYEANWEEWKFNNCGGTSCFDTFSKNSGWKATIQHVRSVPQKVGLSKPGKPMAHKASWSEDGKNDVLIGAYEKACCGTSMHNEWIDLLKYGKQMIYQHPHRIQSPAMAEIARQELMVKL